MKSLVGYTGFVGSNLYENGAFDHAYNSKNIAEAFATKPELLVYAGVRAEMFAANACPEKDAAQIAEAFANIARIEPRRVVLISTISVYGENPCGNEDSAIDECALTSYGKNRLWLEKAVASECKNHLIVRLPALYGKNLKKNFIYDYIHVIPPLLKREKFAELSAQNVALRDFYELQDSGFYKCRTLSRDERAELISFFKSVGFSALTFTDSRSRYQFYNLRFLWGHIQTALAHGLCTLNIATEPVSAGEVYAALEGATGKDFVNELAKPPFDQDLRTRHAALFGGADGYVFNKDFVLNDINKFCRENSK